MPKKKSRKDQIDDAADALKDLNMFYAIIALCEGGLISSDYNAETQRIIGLCGLASARALETFDQCRAAALAE